MDTKEYQAKTYFSWGSLSFEPLQYLLVRQAEIDDCWVVTKENTQESIIVSKKAFQKQLEMGRIIEK